MWNLIYLFTTVEKFIETSLSSSFGIYPNRNLTSETGMSVELGIKQGIKPLWKKYFVDIFQPYTQTQFKWRKAFL